MARKPRIEYPGAFYHVLVRGNHRQVIFREEEDYRRYLKLLRSYKARYGFHLYAFVLMPNHVHLLVETVEIPLSKILQGVQQSHTQYANRKYRLVGHLFQGRYKAILCDKDRYLLALVRYLHLNPVRARLVRDPAEYRWSSHLVYAGKERDEVVRCDPVLRLFAERKSRARQMYQMFIREAIGEESQEEYYRTVDQRILGEEAFVEEVRQKVDQEIETGKRPKRWSLEALGRAVHALTGVTVRFLRGPQQDRRVTRARRLFVLAGRAEGVQGNELAAYLQRDPSLISYYWRKGGLEEETRRLRSRLKTLNIQV